MIYAYNRDTDTYLYTDFAPRTQTQTHTLSVSGMSMTKETKVRYKSVGDSSIGTKPINTPGDMKGFDRKMRSKG